MCDIYPDAPTYEICNNLTEINWNLLSNGQQTITSSITSSCIENNLKLSINIILDYITRSKYTFIQQYDTDRGITYVIDTKPFLSDGRLISNANNCENRELISFDGKDWSTEYWSYLNKENGLNSLNYLEWEDICNTVKYSSSFTFSKLLNCTNEK